MISDSKNSGRICSFWLALPVLAVIGFSAPLWSEEPIKTAPPGASDQQQTDQAAEEPKPPSDFKADDFKPDEEISEDFPVPLPSDI